MQATDVISEVDNVWVANTLPVATKVAWLNDMQRLLYRKCQFPHVEYTAYHKAKVDSYALPADCKPDRISLVRLRQNRRIATVEAVQAWYSKEVPPAPSELDLNGDNLINLDELVLVGSSGSTYVLNPGDEYDYTYVNQMPRAGSSYLDYAYTIDTDTNLRIYPIPTVNGGKVSGVSVTDGGSDYTSAPTVTFSAPTSGSTATGTATVSGGVVTGITITSYGSGYQYPPRITFSGGGGSGATAEASIYTDTLVILYAASPTTITTSDLTVEMFGPSDFHRYYVNRLAAMVAKQTRQSELANGFEADANEIMAQLLTDFGTSPEPGFRVTPVW